MRAWSSSGSETARLNLGGRASRLFGHVDKSAGAPFASCEPRPREGEHATAAVARLDPDPPARGLDHLLRDREPDPGARDTPRRRARGRTCRRSAARAAAGCRSRCRRPRSASRRPRARPTRARRGSTPGATNLTPLPIRFASSCSNSRGRARTTGQLADLHATARRPRSARSGAPARRRRRAPGRAAGVPDARVGEQVLDQRVHALAALARVAEQLGGVRRQRGAVAALEQREEAGDRGQRLAQVVRDDRGEALELGVGALELGGALDRARALARELLDAPRRGR